MKKARIVRIERIVAAILALLILASCDAKEIGGASSKISENENQNMLGSATLGEENKQTTSAPDKQNEETNKEQKEPDESKIEDTSSNKDVEIPNRPVKKPSKDDTSSVKPEEETSSEELSPEELQERELSKRKYIMPPNNPEPVTIDREDAHLPVPISFTDSLQEDGEAIEYKTYEEEGIPTNLDRYIGIIDSRDKMLHPFDIGTARYNEEFFEDNILIAIVVIEGSSPSVHEIKSITHKDGQMCINLKRTRNGENYSQYDGRMLIEISKQDLKDIKTIVVYEEKSSYIGANGEILYDVRAIGYPLVRV